MPTGPVLLVARESAIGPLSDALRSELDCAVEAVSRRRAAIALLRSREFSLVLLEESLAAAGDETVEALYSRVGQAAIVELNFAISGVPRVVRAARAAMVRRRQERERARTDAARSLLGELNESLSGLLLQSQLALRAASPEQAPKLEHVVELAQALRQRLDANSAP